jgi:hypothetical protein
MGDSKSEMGRCGKTGSTAGVGDAIWKGKVVDVGLGSGDVNVGRVKFKVSDTGLAVIEGKFG